MTADAAVLNGPRSGEAIALNEATAPAFQRIPAVRGPDNDMTQDQVMLEMAKAAVSIGKVEWGSTAKKSAKAHGKDTRNSVKITAENFGQSEPQAMHGLYVSGTETVICHTGTSPNSATHARILTALWNHFVAQSEDILKAQQTAIGK